MVQERTTDRWDSDEKEQRPVDGETCPTWMENKNIKVYNNPTFKHFF